MAVLNHLDAFRVLSIDRKVLIVVYQAKGTRKGEDAFLYRSRRRELALNLRLGVRIE